MDTGWYLRDWRKQRGLTIERLADLVGTSTGYVSDLEKGKRRHNADWLRKFAAALSIDQSDLFRHPTHSPAPPLTGMVRIVGKVGAGPDGEILFATADESWGYAPAPPGATNRITALEVVGHSMRGWADDGSLIYFEDQRTPPSPDMLGHMVVVETEDGHVLLKRLLKGSAKDVYDLESVAAPRLENVRIRWAANISAIIPPLMARKQIIRHGEAG